MTVAFLSCDPSENCELLGEAGFLIATCLPVLSLAGGPEDWSMELGGLMGHFFPMKAITESSSHNLAAWRKGIACEVWMTSSNVASMGWGVGAYSILKMVEKELYNGGLNIRQQVSPTVSRNLYLLIQYASP